MAIVDHGNWRELGRLVEVYQQNREVYMSVSLLALCHLCLPLVAAGHLQSSGRI